MCNKYLYFLFKIHVQLYQVHAYICTCVPNESLITCTPVHTHYTEEDDYFLKICSK